MNLIPGLLGAYLMYIILGAAVTYVLVVRALRADEQAATVDLDRELRELVAQARV